MLLTHIDTSVIVKDLTQSILIFMTLSLRKKLTSFDTKSQRGSDLLPNACLKSVPGFPLMLQYSFYHRSDLFVVYACTHIHINKRFGKTERNMETRHERTQLETTT